MLRTRSEQRGATAVEYGIMVALIAGVIIAAVLAVGVSTGETFEAPCDELAAVGQPC